MLSEYPERKSVLLRMSEYKTFTVMHLPYRNTIIIKKSRTQNSDRKTAWLFGIIQAVCHAYGKAITDYLLILISEYQKIRPAKQTGKL